MERWREGWIKGDGEVDDWRERKGLMEARGGGLMKGWVVWWVDGWKNEVSEWQMDEGMDRWVKGRRRL